MGVIYSTQEFINNDIPDANAHQVAADLVMDKVGNLDSTTLTVVHGSVVDKRWNVRSDLDVLVLYDVEDPSQEPTAIRGISGVLNQIQADTHVKVESNVWPATEPIQARRERMYDILYSRHLAGSMLHPIYAEGQRDDVVLEIAQESFDEELMLRALLHFGTYKHTGFTKAPLEFSEGDKELAVLQRAFELPKSIGRKVDQFLGSNGEATANKSWETLLSSGMNQQTIDALERLRHLDTSYTNLVEDLAKDAGKLKPSQIDWYRGWLERRYAEAIDLGIIASSGLIVYLSKES